MLRAVNLIVEVFVDVTSDGGYAEALLLHSADRSLLAQGFARVAAGTEEAEPAGEPDVAAAAMPNGLNAVVAAALEDLVGALAPVPGRNNRATGDAPATARQAGPGHGPVPGRRPPVPAGSAVA